MGGACLPRAEARGYTLASLRDGDRWGHIYPGLLAEAFEEHGVSYALGGALAYGLWGTPRATVDVDVHVFVTDRELDTVFDALESLEIRLDRFQMRAEHQSRGMFTVQWSYQIDVFTPSIDFSWEAERTRSEHEIEGRQSNSCDR